MSEPVYWRRYGSTYPVSNLHRREPGAARTACGLNIPRLPPAIEEPEGEVYAGADGHEPDWDGLRCVRCYPPANRAPRASRARWRQVDRERELKVGGHHAAVFRAGASEIWVDGRGSTLSRRVDGWLLVYLGPGISAGRSKSYTLLDGARPRRKPPTAWANRTLRTGRA